MAGIITSPSFMIKSTGGLYGFFSFTFTSVGLTGSVGPTLSQCLSSYDTTTYPWLADTSLFNVTTTGIQSWTCPIDGLYSIECYGAQGGFSGGAGGYAKGNIILQKNQILSIVVGQVGESILGGWGGGGGANQANGGGGGGASDVRIGGVALSNRVIVAGGGGGKGEGTGGTGGGANGGGGVGTSTSGGGGGTQSAGGAGGVNIGGRAGTAGVLGVGGNGGNNGGGGGGGYYGGGGGAYYAGANDGGGGGGSGYVGGMLTGTTTNSNGLRTGNGQVTITKL